MVKLKKGVIHIRRGFAHVKGLGFILWRARHEFYHALLGVAWAWVLREVWNEFNVKWLMLSVFASLLPDLEHLFYWVSEGHRDPYVKKIRSFVRNGEWRAVAMHIEKGHKDVTELSYHNIYVVIGLLVATGLCFLFDWNLWVVIFGAMVLHYLFDIADDFVILGYLNTNWKRWGKGRKRKIR
jgi:hypothetical protein